MGSLKKFSPLILAASLLLGTLSCENVTTIGGPSGLSESCLPGQAQLVVYDTFIQSICGCQESPDIARPPDSLTCTVNAGTTVWFWYTSTTLFHQIQSTAQPTFPTSPLNDPHASNPVRTHVVTLSSPGNYEFADVYNHAINGTIVAQ